MRPRAADLFSGLGGWAEGLIAEGYDVVGYDIVDMFELLGIQKPDHYQLVIRDVLTMHGSELKDFDLIVSSSPCTEYSWMAMPWSRAKQVGRAIQGDGDFPDKYKGSRNIQQLNALFDAQFRLQKEASEAKGEHIPLIVENVRGAQKWVGRAPYHYGSFYPWGDVPALMPTATTRGMKGCVGTINGSGKPREQSSCADGFKVPGISLSAGQSVGFNVTAAQRYRDGVKFEAASSSEWFDGKPKDKVLGSKGPAAYGSRSNSRKAASAMIAKIPYPLASHIAKTFYPRD